MERITDTDGHSIVCFTRAMVAAAENLRDWRDDAATRTDRFYGITDEPELVVGAAGGELAWCEQSASGYLADGLMGCICQTFPQPGSEPAGDH